MNDTFEQLVNLFKQFPGIGVRQAKRFVYFLLSKDEAYVRALIERIQASRSTIRQCQESFQYFVGTPDETLSPLVRDPERTKESLMIVIKDMDLEAIEHAHIYHGQYFVLGNLVPMIAHDVERFVRVNELLEIIKKRAMGSGLREIIFATPANPEGDHTKNYLHEKIRPLIDQYHLTVTTLGRGLSSGSELEYIDPSTFQGAFRNRG